MKRDKNTDVSSELQQTYKDMYCTIAQSMDAKTEAFKLPHPQAVNPCILHLCMAPGGYTDYTLVKHPKVTVYGITLPEDQGGHKMLLQGDPSRVRIENLDMNLMLGEFGMVRSEVLRNHPDYERFREQPVFKDQKFQVVLCDGAVLEAHMREGSRQDRDLEGLKLRLIQVIFGLKHIVPGGSFIMLLHRIESSDNLELLRRFEKFSKIQIFKPEHVHAYSSSFYLVAKDVQPKDAVARSLLQKLEANWLTTTFGGEESTGRMPEEPSEGEVDEALKEYGRRLIELGSPVWNIQAEALKRAPYLDSREISNRGGVNRLLSENWRASMSSPREAVQWRHSGTATIPQPQPKENRRPDPRNLASWRDQAPK